MKIKLRTITIVAIMASISIVLMFIELAIPVFPFFLKLDISDLPALIVSFLFGPLAGILIELVKNAFHLTSSITGGVGELANFLVGASFVGTAGLVYKLKHNHTGAVISCVAATIAMTLVGMVVNYYITLPAYSSMMPIEQIVSLSAKANGAIKDMWTLIFYGITPFNLFKGLIISVISLFIYKRISHVIKRK